MKDIWFDTRLTEEEMNFLNEAISEKDKENWRNKLAGNISKSEVLMDKDNWFFKSVLEKPTKGMFYRDWDNYYKYHIEKEEPPPEFELESFWVNYQKQHEFNPIHDHSGVYSFVIFMKIPTHWKEQHALPFSANSNAPRASDFHFVFSNINSEKVNTMPFFLSPEDEGRMLFFPAPLRHMVYPFYECEEERVTISGNIILIDPDRPQVDPDRPQVEEVVEMSGDVYEEKVQILKMLENSIKVTKKELEWMKKKE